MILAIAVLIGVLASFVDPLRLVVGLILIAALGILIVSQVNLGAAALLVLIFGSAGWNRDFSRLTLPGVPFPLYITEMLLLIAVLGAVVLIAQRKRASLSPTVAFTLLCFVGYGFFLLVSGLLAGYGMAALRDFSLFYYAVLTLLVAVYSQQERFEVQALKTLVFGALAGSMQTIGTFLIEPSTIIRYGHVGHSALALTAWGSILVLAPGIWVQRSRWKRLALVGGIGVLMGTIALSGYRTMALVALATLLGANVIARGKLDLSRVAKRMNRAVAAGLALLVLGVVAGASFGGEHGTFFADLGQRFQRLVVSSSEDNSTEFRMTAWSNAMNYISERPLQGIGLGAPAVLYDPIYCSQGPDSDSNCGSPHNTFLTYLMRSGIIGLALFLTVNAVVWVSALRSLKVASGKGVVRLWLMCLMLIGMLTYGVTSLLFESPYLAAQYWVLLGLVQTAAQRLARVGNTAPLEGPSWLDQPQEN